MINLAQNLGQKFVNSVFSDVHTNYDKTNDLMSMFLHRKWKKYFVNMLNIQKESRVLDLASGTGDIVKLLLQKTNNIVASDINNDMLEIAKHKINSNFVDFIIADATKLPFEDAKFDCITCTFGIRNFEEIQKAIYEASRVLKSGGKFAIMEFMPNTQGYFFDKLYKIYIKNLLPKYDYIFKNKTSSYEYLSKSILQFQTRDNFMKMLELAEFEVVTPSFLNGGVGVFICTKK